MARIAISIRGSSRPACGHTERANPALGVIVRKVFVSYARANRPHVEQLVEHLGVLDCQTWFDSSLRGGQDWWEQILDRITDCDVFIAIISREALNSVACRREFDWADALGKPVLPVALQPPSQALPQRFSRRQIVGYSDPANRDRAALILAGGLAALPAAQALPEPLPDAPSAPLSYLTELVDRVSTPGFLDHDQQRQILFQLEAAVRSVDPEERRGGRDILERFSSRDDLYADVDRMITSLKGSAAPETDAKTVVAEPPGPGPVKTTQPATETEPTATDATLKTEPPSPTPLTGDSDQTTALLADHAAPPRQPWWRRQAIVIPAALVTVAVIVAAIVITSQRHENSNGPQITPPTGQTQTAQPAYAPQAVLPFTGLNLGTAGGVAVDSAGNLYVVDGLNNRVVKLAAGSSAQAVLPFTGLSVPKGVAVDAAGNLYVTDQSNSRVLKLPAG